MDKVSIYVTHFNRLELLNSQYAALLNHCKDENFDYIVINNGVDIHTKKEIENFCETRKIKQIQIFNNDKIAMTAMNHKFALQYCYDNYISKDQSYIRVVMDADIIPFEDFKFSELLGDNQMAGIQMDYGYEGDRYIASFISIFRQDVNIEIDLGKDMEFDSGLGTYHLVKKYKTKFLDHTAPMRKREGDYVFKNKLEGSFEYSEDFGIQFIEKCFIHYYRGSGWDNGDPNYYDRKKRFVDHFLQNKILYNPVLDNNVHYDHAHMDQWIHQEDYNLYKYEKLSDISN